MIVFHHFPDPDNNKIPDENLHSIKCYAFMSCQSWEISKLPCLHALGHKIYTKESLKDPPYAKISTTAICSPSLSITRPLYLSIYHSLSPLSVCLYVQFCLSTPLCLSLFACPPSFSIPLSPSFYLPLTVVFLYLSVCLPVCLSASITSSVSFCLPTPVLTPHPLSLRGSNHNI